MLEETWEEETVKELENMILEGAEGQLEQGSDL